MSKVASNTNADILGILSDKSNVTTDSDKIGALRSDITAIIHTREALLLLTGKQKDETRKFGVMGLYGFSNPAKALEIAVRGNDPFADQAFDTIYKAVTLARSSLKDKSETFKMHLRNTLPAGFNLGESENRQPVELSLKFNSILAYQIAFLVIEQDEFFRILRAGRHIGLLDNDTLYLSLREQQKITRRIMISIFNYHFCDVTRIDASENNQRWQNALAKMPDIKITEGILSGEQRNVVAPPINTSKLGLTNKVGTDIASQLTADIATNNDNEDAEAKNELRLQQIADSTSTKDNDMVFIVKEA